MSTVETTHLVHAEHASSVSMPESPLAVSIIIPAYNAATTISDTLNSVLNQTYGYWETIIVDDGSTDRTNEIVREFSDRDQRVQVIRQANMGEAGARNSGLARACFDWLLFLDADDWISPLHLERMIAQIQSDSGLDAVHCAYARVAADGTEIVDSYQAPSGDLFPTLARRSAFPVHACIVRKAVVNEAGGFDISLRTCTDWDLWQRIARTGARFGAVREVLAYYRMSPGAASLNAYQLFQDDLRVLKQGHAPDPRVKNPKPEHANGAPPEQVQSQVFYLLSWCAGLLLGSGKDARPLLELVGDDHYSELYPDAMARCIFDSAVLPHCQAPNAWERLWLDIGENVENFLVALEKQSMTEDLARHTTPILKTMILRESPSWSPTIKELESGKHLAEERGEGWQKLAMEREQCIEEQNNTLEELKKANVLLEEERNNLRRLAKDREQELDKQKAVVGELKEAVEELKKANVQELDKQKTLVGELKQTVTASEQKLNDLHLQLKQQVAERNDVMCSDERRFGDLVLNRLRLRKPLLGAAYVLATINQGLMLAKLHMESRLLRRNKQNRIMTTVCDIFPIYSQTFVYQELGHLARHGFDLRLVYSNLDRREYLSARFDDLWNMKRRLFLNHRAHEKDFVRYQARMPEKVESLIDKLSESSGMRREDLIRQGNFLQAFSFTRMVEAYSPQYLHSYFFYDRSLMALVASYLLDIPRGVSCYADHLLKDYELKVVPLHLELCSIIIATSERIKRELLEIAPQADSTRILVKPNGIDTEFFPIMQRAEPAQGEPFRLVSVCRIEPKKGLIELVEAVTLLRQRGLDVEAHIVGAVDEWSQASRDYKRMLDEKISELNLWGRVHLEGRHDLSGILRFLGMAHLFVAPFVETDGGDKDGIPTALLEGMATGLAAVATDTGSIAEVIDNGRDSVLCAQRDPAALATAIEALLRDPRIRLQLGREAAGKVRRCFDVRTCEAVFHESIRAVLSLH
jgi:glycosyltransferase involved in cell wall biosynthesis